MCHGIPKLKQGERGEKAKSEKGNPSSFLKIIFSKEIDHEDRAHDLTVIGMFCRICSGLGWAPGVRNHSGLLFFYKHSTSQPSDFLGIYKKAISAWGLYYDKAFNGVRDKMTNFSHWKHFAGSMQFGFPSHSGSSENIQHIRLQGHLWFPVYVGRGADRSCLSGPQQMCWNQALDQGTRVLLCPTDVLKVSSISLNRHLNYQLRPSSSHKCKSSGSSYNLKPVHSHTESRAVKDQKDVRRLQSLQPAANKPECQPACARVGGGADKSHLWEQTHRVAEEAAYTPGPRTAEGEDGLHIRLQVDSRARCVLKRQ